jgi:hypothetical protein
VLWGDRVHEVAADDESVMFSDEDGHIIILSHAEMREIVLAWERHEMREAESHD